MMRGGVPPRGPTPGGGVSGPGQTTQFALSSRGGMGLNNDDQLPETAERLLAINPDGWRNIAYCVINAFKILIDDQIQQEQRLREVNSSQEELRKKTQFMLKRLQKDLNKKEENFLAQIDKVEKNMTGQFNKLRIEVENSLSKNDLKVEENMQMVEVNLEKIEEKISKIEDSDVVKAWALQQVNNTKGDLIDEINKVKEQAVQQLNDVVNTNLIVPDIVGDDYMYPNMAIYVQETYRDFTKKLEEFERLQAEVEPHMDNALERFKLLESESKLLNEKAKNLDKTIAENNTSITQKAETIEGTLGKFKEEVKEMEKMLMARQEKMLAEHKSGLDEGEVQEIVDRAKQEINTTIEAGDKTQELKEIHYKIDERERDLKKKMETKNNELEAQIIQLSEDMLTESAIREQVSEIVGKKLEGEIIGKFDEKLKNIKGELVKETLKSLEDVKTDLSLKMDIIEAEISDMKNRPPSVMSNASKKEQEAKLNQEQINAINTQIEEVAQRITEIEENLDQKFKEVDERLERPPIQEVALSAARFASTKSVTPDIQSKAEIEKAPTESEHIASPTPPPPPLPPKEPTEPAMSVKGTEGPRTISQLSKKGSIRVSSGHTMSMRPQMSQKQMSVKEMSMRGSWRASTKEPLIMKDPEMDLRMMRLEEEFRKMAIHLQHIQQVVSSTASASRQAIVIQKQEDGMPIQAPSQPFIPQLPADMSMQELMKAHPQMSHTTLSGAQHPSIPTMMPTILPEQLQLPPGPGQESRLKEYIQENVSPQNLKYQEDVANTYKMPYILNQFHTTPHTLVQRERIPIKVDFEPLEGLDQFNHGQKRDKSPQRGR